MGVKWDVHHFSIFTPSIVEILIMVFPYYLSTNEMTKHVLETSTGKIGIMSMLYRLFVHSLRITKVFALTSFGRKPRRLLWTSKFPSLSKPPFMLWWLIMPYDELLFYIILALIWPLLPWISCQILRRKSQICLFQFIIYLFGWFSCFPGVFPKRWETHQPW